jgi:hypothetical protein
MPPRSPSLTSSLYEDTPFTPPTCDVDDHTHQVTDGNLPRPLGIILDLDGTLIAENEEPEGAPGDFLRPAAVEFLQWCLARGHSLALWTAAHSSWAHYVSWKLCTAVHHHRGCEGSGCRKTFDFVWSQSRLNVRKRIPVSTHGEVDGCRWCEHYRRQCDRCECHGRADGTGNLFTCPCRSTKDLNKVWKKQKMIRGFSKAFSRERTILIENTPQQCIRNYGNAVYVPTYSGNAAAEARDPIFQRLKAVILEMERAQDVRSVERCSHGKEAHACFEQNWWHGKDAFCMPVSQGAP